jgi:hypothetical protein
MHTTPIYDLTMTTTPRASARKKDPSWRSAAAAFLALPLVVLGGGCASASSTGAVAPHAGRVASLNLSATLVHDQSGDAARDTVMSEIRVVDSVGSVLAAPRILTAVGSPGSIRVGTEHEFIEVLVISRREGAAVVVTATCSEDGGPPRVEARAEAR